MAVNQDHAHNYREILVNLRSRIDQLHRNLSNYDESEYTHQYNEFLGLIDIADMLAERYELEIGWDIRLERQMAQAEDPLVHALRYLEMARGCIYTLMEGIDQATLKNMRRNLERGKDVLVAFHAEAQGAGNDPDY